MPQSLKALSIALFVVSAQARNDTVVKGWVPEPNGRGTWSIVWSSLATIFICTWSVLHLTVKKQGRWRSFLRKCRYMCVAVLMPEVILSMSVGHFLDARRRIPALVRYGGSEWTMTHAQFALDFGFETSSAGGPLYLQEIIELIAKGEISQPPISEEELQSRGDSNWLVKIIALLQIFWFALQTLFRTIQHLQVTPLEVLVIAFVFCSIFTYMFYWSKPQNVEYTVLIPQEVQTSDYTTIALTQSHEGVQGQQEASKLTTRTTSRLPEEYSVRAACIACLVLMTLFGAIHCLAWNSPFPSPAEQLSWRICAILTTSLPALVGGTLLCLPSDDVEKFIYDEGEMSDVVIFTGRSVTVLAIVLYGAPRLILIVLAFTALRVQPSDAYQTVSWTQYLPNFAP